MATPTSLSQLENTLEDVFARKAPALPKGLKEFIVTVAPWLTLILMIMLAPLLLGVLGFGALLAPIGFLGGVDTGLFYMLGLVVSAATLVLHGLALPGLFKRRLSGWRLAFYASLVSLVGGLLQMQFLSALVGAAIGWYILFQIKSYYK